MHRIVEYLYKRPLLVRLIMVFILLLAAASFFQIKRLSYPLVDMMQMEIVTLYPGASPEDVEVNLTIKLEEQLKKVVGIQKFTSKSVENMSSIHVWIDQEASDIRKVKDDIYRAIESVSDLPAEVSERSEIIDYKVENSTIYDIAIASETLSDKEIAYHAKELRKKLLDLPSTSFVNKSGMPAREIQILLNKERMNELYIAFDEVIDAIKNNNLKLSGGSLESYTEERGIVTFSEFSKPSDIENIILRAGDSGSDVSIRIKDIGTVVDGFEKKDAVFRFNGKHGTSLAIAKKANADIIRFVDNELVPALEEYKSEFAPEGMDIFTLYDGSFQTKSRLKVVYMNASAGFILVVLVLFFFLNWRIALWTSAGIPISVALTLIVLPRFGITINSISLCGLVVVLGMVVDDAIIVSESIYRAKEMGLKGIEAVTSGLRKVIRPVFGTILTTIIAFTPMYFIPGVIGDFTLEIPSIVIIMLAASFAEATTLLPVHLAEDKSESESSKSSKKTKSQAPGQRFILLLEKLYRKLLQKALRHRFVTLGFLVLFLAIGGGLAAKFLKFNMFPVDQSYRIWIVGNTSGDANLQFTADEILKIEEIITKIPEEGALQSFNAFVGRDYYENIAASNAFTIGIVLNPASERKMSAEDVRDYIKEAIAKTDLGSIENIVYFIDGGGPIAGKPLELRIIGNDNEKRAMLTASIKSELHKLGVTDIESNVKSEKEEFRLLPNYENIAASQLSVAEISSVIRTAIDGTVVSHMNTPEEQIPFRVMLDEKSKDFVDPLKDLHVRNKLGLLVPVKNLVHVSKGKAVQNMYHYNGDRTNTITGNIDLEKTTPKEVYAKLTKQYKTFEKENPGFKLVIGGEAEESNKVFIQMLIATGVAVLLIYFILVLQFNSMIQPGMVIMAIPFGLVGIFVMFMLQGMELSMMSLIGILGFSGVVVNDSLIMVDFINSLLKNKDEYDTKELIAAIIDGAVMRFRPILLTTVTTVAGLFPTAYGLIGGFDAFISPMVMAMMWGLVIGTTSILIGIPVLYLFVYDFSSFCSKLSAKVFGSKRRALAA